MQLSGISDGLANTLLMVEIAGRPNRYTRKKNLGVQNYYAGTWAGVNGEMIYAIEERVTIAPSAGTCIINCNNFYTPFSFHRGSVNASYCDGSVHSVSETIDKIAWKQLVQPDDNELRETE
jgi:prepilin-type processing-associated H-X9-DG protein